VRALLQGWATFLSYMIVLFPPLDIMSAFPLNAITLGNNLLTSFVSSRHKQQQRKYIIPFRLLAAIPPIAGACGVPDLAPVLRYTGCIGVVIAFLFPCLLQWRSVQLWHREFPPSMPLDDADADAADALAPDQPLKAPLMADAPSSAFTFSHPILQKRAVIGATFAFSLVGLIAVFVLSFTSG
jgi:hypothetical protein